MSLGDPSYQEPSVIRGHRCPPNADYKKHSPPLPKKDQEPKYDEESGPIEKAIGLVCVTVLVTGLLWALHWIFHRL